MEKYQWIFTLPSLIAIGIVGMFTHFLKKNITGETVAEVKDYFTNHFRSTLIAFIATVFGVAGYYFSMATGQLADIILVGSLGYNFDSLLNKWDKV